MSETKKDIQPAGAVDGVIAKIFQGFKRKPSVSVLRLEGVLSASSGIPGRSNSLNLRDLEEDIEKAFARKKCKAVILQIDSPGGCPTQSYLIANRIKQLSKEKEIPVIACVERVAASGGYWLACAADEIVALPTSIIGSIGVVASLFGFPAFLERHGIERRVYAQGKNKVQLDPFLPEKQEDVDFFKNLMKEMHQMFIAEVEDRRKGKLFPAKGVELFDGSFWHAERAKKYGLIDGVNDLQTLAKERFGEKIHIYYINKEKHWLKRKLGIFCPERWVDTGLLAIEQRVLYSRYGL